MRRIVAVGFGVGALALAGMLWAGSSGWLHPASDTTRSTDGASAPDSGKGGGQRRQTSGPVAVKTATAERVDFPVKVRSIGFAEPVATVVVKSRIDSQIVQQKIVEGQFVSKGDLLFELDDTELKAQLAQGEAALQRDIAVHDRTVADRQRKENLITKGAVSPQTLDQSVSDEKVAAAAIESDKASIAATKQKLSYAKIYSPINGRAGAVQVTPGNLVAANASGNGLVTVTQMKPIRVTFALPERELGKLKARVASESPPVVKVFAVGSSVPLAEGHVSFLDSSVDLSSGTVTVKATFDNTDLALWPGQYLDVVVTLSTVADAVAVPSPAVQTGQNGTYAYVVSPDRTVDLRPVTVAAVDGDRTALTAGLAAGERVVTEGQLRLTRGARVIEMPTSREAGNPSNAETAAGAKPTSKLP